LSSESPPNPKSTGLEKSGIYIHFPFCRAKCSYCGFSSFTSDAWKHVYHEFLLAEIEKAGGFFGPLFQEADTVYFGGGTPSLLPPFALNEILTRLRSSGYFTGQLEEMEITVEANPDDLGTEYLKSIHTLGINRLSVGAQRFNRKLLEILGRTHSVNDSINGIKNAKDAGFKNISIDFILGIPGERRASMKKEMEALLKLEPQHISVYMLELKEHTPFALMNPNVFPDDNLTADLYMEVAEKLTAAGYDHYEISNFAKPGFRSKHNLKYWYGGKWLGLGLAAASYSGDARWTNPQDLQGYFDYVMADDFSIPPQNALTERRKLAEEEFFMGMRKTSGININLFKERWGFDPLEGIAEDILQFVEEGLLIMDEPPGTIRFTLRGFLLSNEILCRFIS
jgi:oxygen-independent coproporphyrinogen-3 oxidase